MEFFTVPVTSSLFFSLKKSKVWMKFLFYISRLEPASITGVITAAYYKVNI